MSRPQNETLLPALLTLVFLVGCGTTQPIDQGAVYYEQGLYDQAAEYWQPIALAGNAIAQHNMGALSRDGLGQRPLDLNLATKWFRQSAEQDYVPAMVSLAEVQLSLGNEVDAESWLILAARWGSIDAIELLEKRGVSIPDADLYKLQMEEEKLEKLRSSGEMMRPAIRERNR